MSLQDTHLSASQCLRFGSMASPTFHRGSRGGNPSEPAGSCCLSPEGKDLTFSPLCLELMFQPQPPVFLLLLMRMWKISNEEKPTK